MTQLDAIFGKPGDTAIDPVCKMTVNKANPGGGKAEHAGETRPRVGIRGDRVGLLLVDELEGGGGLAPIGPEEVGERGECAFHVRGDAERLG